MALIQNPAVVPVVTAQLQPQLQAMRLMITKVPFTTWFTITCEDKTSHDLEPDEARKWLTDHGADSLSIDKVLDYVWNFYQAGFQINNPRYPQVVGGVKPMV